MIYSSNLSYKVPLETTTTTNSYKRNEIIPVKNEILWRIDRGIVSTCTWNEDGKAIILGYWNSGDVIGYALSKVKPYQVRCLTNVELTILPPQFWHKELDAFVSHIQTSEQLLSIVHTTPMSSRLREFLLWLSEKFGRDTDIGKLIELPITHQEMADVLNISRVSVTRTLQEFEAEGWLFRHKRQLILKLPTQRYLISLKEATNAASFFNKCHLVLQK